MNKISRLSIIPLLLLLHSGCSSEETDTKQETASTAVNKKSIPERIVYTKSPADIMKLFDELGYTKKAWQEGIREVPRVFLTNIPKRWKNESDHIPVAEKKEIFFRLLGPAILRSNELITAERESLKRLAEKYPQHTPEEKQLVIAMAKKYKLLKNGEDSHIDKTTMEELLLRVDIIPASLALAQGAEESGWGTSRFALLGNSLFGQWDFSGKGITPKQQRKELGNYGLARFDKPQDAVNAYMLNLNTHSAYKKLRIMRSDARAANKKLNGYDLAGSLDKYSERGDAYVKGLRSMMSYNKLQSTDDAYLWNKEIIYLTPKE